MQRHEGELELCVLQMQMAHCISKTTFLDVADAAGMNVSSSPSQHPKLCCTPAISQSAHLVVHAGWSAVLAVRMCTCIVMPQQPHGDGRCSTKWRRVMVKALKSVALQKKGKAPGGKRPRQQTKADGGGSGGGRKGALKATGNTAKRQKLQAGIITFLPSLATSGTAPALSVSTSAGHPAECDGFSVQSGVQRPNKQPKGKHRPAQQPQDDEEDSADEEEMDEEDLDFVRRLGAPAAAFLSSLDATEAAKYASLLQKNRGVVYAGLNVDAVAQGHAALVCTQRRCSGHRRGVCFA
jgi:hypothetical protein